MQRLARKHLATQVSDVRLRQRLTPTWRIGCKRMLISNTWYPTLQRSNFALVTDPITEVRPNGVVTADGTVREVDAIVVATGFHVTDSPAYDTITGANGATLAQAWQQTRMQAYKGAAVTGFPNLFFLVGPNTGLGHTSMVYMIESQLNYLMDALATMATHGIAELEVRSDPVAGLRLRLPAHYLALRPRRLPQRARSGGPGNVSRVGQAAPPRFGRRSAES